MSWLDNRENTIETQQPTSKSDITAIKPVSSGFDIDSVLIPIEQAASKRGLKVGVYGGPGVGKTQFALSFPPPIVILDTEIGSPALAKHFQGKDIKVVDVYQKGNGAERDEVECFEKIKQAVTWISNNMKEGTVIIDSGSDLWKFAQTYGKVKIFNLSPQQRLKYRFDWGKITNLYEQILATLIHSDLNLVITGKVGSKYDAGGQETGETVSRWQKDTEYQLDITIEMLRTRLKDKNIFYGIINKCRINGELMGQKIDNLTYDVLKQKIEGDKKCLQE